MVAAQSGHMLEQLPKSIRPTLWVFQKENRLLQAGLWLGQRECPQAARRCQSQGNFFRPVSLCEARCHWRSKTVLEELRPRLQIRAMTKSESLVLYSLGFGTLAS